MNLKHLTMTIPPHTDYTPKNIVPAIFTRDHVIQVGNWRGSGSVIVRFKAGDVVLADEDHYTKNEHGETVWHGVPVLINERGGSDKPLLAFVQGPKDLFQLAPDGTEPGEYDFEYVPEPAPSGAPAPSRSRSLWPWALGIVGLCVLAYAIIDHFTSNTVKP